MKHVFHRSQVQKWNTVYQVNDLSWVFVSKVYRSAVDVWLLFYHPSIFQASFFNINAFANGTKPDPNNEIILRIVLKFGRILRCLLLFSFQSLDQDITEKTKIGLIWRIDNDDSRRSVRNRIFGFSSLLSLLSLISNPNRFSVMIWYHRSGLHDHIWRGIEFYCSSGRFLNWSFFIRLIRLISTNRWYSINKCDFILLVILLKLKFVKTESPKK